MGIMTKRAAHLLIDAGPLTFGHLRHYLLMVREHAPDGPSVVNPSLTRHAACDMLAAGFTEYGDNDLIQSPTYTERRNAMLRLAATNILRETHYAGSPAPTMG